MTAYSMYGAVPLKTIKQALLNLKGENRLDRVKMIDLTNCTFDGHIYNTRRVMEECLAIKPDLIFLWDEAWFGFARFSPFLRPRTAMGAANDIEAWMHDPKSVQAFEKQRAELGDNPSNELLLKTRLIPDPRADPAARLPHPFHPQVDVGAAAGIDADRQGRRIPHRGAAIQGSGVYPRLDQSQPAIDRQPRCGAPPDGAGRALGWSPTRWRLPSPYGRRSPQIR